MSFARRHITIIQGHPDRQRCHFGHALEEAYVRGAREAGHDVERLAVATLAFPLLSDRTDLEYGAPPESIRQAQLAIARADHVLMIYPIWNGAAPALLKGFLEQTFRPAFTFPDVKPGERLGFKSWFSQRKALMGKSARVVITMQMPAFVYRLYFHPHPEKNTLRVAGLGPIRESLIGRVELPNGRTRGRWLARMYGYGLAGQ